jgi:hypothetical protein
LQGRRLHTSRGLEHAARLVKELENFRVKITAAMKEQFESVREGLYDDLVLATAMAAWAGELELRGRIKRARELQKRKPPTDSWEWTRLPY